MQLDMMRRSSMKAYETAKERYAAIDVDTETAIEKLDKIPIYLILQNTL